METPVTPKRLSERGGPEGSGQRGVPPAGAPPPALEPFSHRRPGRRVTRIALAVSALLHLLLIALYPTLFGSGRPFSPSGESLQPTRPAGTEVIRLREVADAAPLPGTPTVPLAPAPAPAAPAAPAADPPPAAPPPVTPAPAPPVPAEPAPAQPSAAERLRRTDVDARLWTRTPESTELTAEQLAQLQILWAILEMSDSTAAAAAAARALTDWTFTDASGRRWGVSEGQVHLGDITLPLPFVFGGPLRDGDALRGWQDADILRGAGAAAARATINDRVRAIRERLDQQRQLQPRDTAGGPP